MRKKDVLTKEYLSVGERFADAVNVGVFKGKQVVSPSQIQEIDSTSDIVLKGRTRTKPEVEQQCRDILKTVAYNTNFCIIGIENQSDVHYIFPVRNMLYDASAYKKQWNAIKKTHQKKKDLTKEEFLSGFSKKDSLQAVITLVVYYGTEPWDGAKDIHSLIDWTDIPEELREAVPNYSIHLLDLSQYENPEDFKTDLKVICRFLKNAGDKKKIKKMLEEYKEDFENIEEDTYDLIGAFGDMEQIDELKAECKNEKKGYNMCKGMREWAEEKEEIGRSKGLEQGREQVLTEQIKKKVEKGYTPEEISDLLEMEMKEVRQIMKQIQ